MCTVKSPGKLFRNRGAHPHPPEIPTQGGGGRGGPEHWFSHSPVDCNLQPELGTTALVLLKVLRPEKEHQSRLKTCERCQYQDPLNPPTPGPTEPAVFILTNIPGHGALRWRLLKFTRNTGLILMNGTLQGIKPRFCVLELLQVIPLCTAQIAGWSPQL